MNLECLNGIITDNLAIHIDLTNVNSWRNWNTGLTAFSLTKWAGAVSDNINLMDFGLTEFDNGRTNVMWEGITILPEDTLFSVYRVGFNEVINPTTGNTSGVSATTTYSGYTISAVTSGTTSGLTTPYYYFNLTGGYLQGFFKLDGFNYELLPSRYNKGLTIETILHLDPSSHGIFYMMGARAEDKYNPYFSGETTVGTSGSTTIGFQGTVIATATGITETGVVTSYNDFLDAFTANQVLKKGFRAFEDRFKTEHNELPPIDNLKNNVIAFGLTQDRRIFYKYINADGLIVTNSSPSVVKATGYTIIDIVFTPDNIFDTPLQLECSPQRTGKIIFYVNGRATWIIHDFSEYYFHRFNNDKEKQIGVPYSISWGGGSFGLEHSYHYDYQTYVIYNGQDINYIQSNFFVQNDPIIELCSPFTGDTHITGLSVSADTQTWKAPDICNPSILIPETTIRIQYTGETGTTTGKTYFLKFIKPISVLSNRDYRIDLSMYDGGFFKLFDSFGTAIHNKITVVVFSDTVDISILKDMEYINPITSIDQVTALGLHPFPDRQEFEYIYINGVMYYGVNGLPVYDQNGNLILFNELNANFIVPSMQIPIISGQNVWNKLYSVFRTPENSGQKFVNIGLLIETSNNFNPNKPLFISGFTYTAADILVQDARKDNLLIQENFNSGFIGGIQKLRVYDNALTSPEVLHNALEEKLLNPTIIVNKGGRIIHR